MKTRKTPDLCGSEVQSVFHNCISRTPLELSSLYLKFSANSRFSRADLQSFHLSTASCHLSRSSKKSNPSSIISHTHTPLSKTKTILLSSLMPVHQQAGFLCLVCCRKPLWTAGPQAACPGLPDSCWTALPGTPKGHRGCTGAELQTQGTSNSHDSVRQTNISFPHRSVKQSTRHP